MVAIFLDEFTKAKIEEPVQRELYERNGRRQLKAFLGSPAAVPRGEVAMVEHRFKLEIAGAEVTGRIDRVDEDEDGLLIVDYKTGKPKSQELADESLQLSVYALALRKQGPVKAVIFQNLEDSSTVETTRARRRSEESGRQDCRSGAGHRGRRLRAQAGIAVLLVRLPHGLSGERAGDHRRKCDA